MAKMRVSSVRDEISDENIWWGEKKLLTLQPRIAK